MSTLIDAFGPTAEIVGSVLLFLVLLTIMVFAHELGHFLTAKRAGIMVEEFAVGFPPRVWSKKRGETEYSINAIPLGGYCKMLGEEDPTYPRSFARASRPWRLIVLAAGALMNFLLAIILFSSAYLVGVRVPDGPMQVVVVQPQPGLPAAAAGLQSGDAIVSLAGQPVGNVQDLRTISEAHKGETIPVVVKRDGQEQTLQITPRASWPTGEGPLGVSIGEQAAGVKLATFPIPSAIAMGAGDALRMVVLTFSLPVAAIQGLIPWDVVRPVGPLGMYQATTEVVRVSINQGWWSLPLQFVASLSTALGIANLLPIPGLDGGRIIFVLIEAIRGRRISPQREGMIHLIGMAVLLSLVLAITFVDITSPIHLNFGP